MKKSVWDKILKIVIAIASAIVGALSTNAMNGIEKKRADESSSARFFLPIYNKITLILLKMPLYNKVFSRFHH